MNRSRTEGRIPWVVLLLTLGVPGVYTEAGPIVTHPLATGSGQEAGSEDRPSGVRSVSVLPVPVPRVSDHDGSVRGTLNHLGYPVGLSGSLPDAVVESEVRRSLPSGGRGETGRPWLVPARPGRLRAASPFSGNPTRPIPEPASLLLLVTGLVGLFARRRLLRGR